MSHAPTAAGLSMPLDAVEVRFGRGVAAAAAVLAAAPSVRWARLFGSRARGQAAARADIDLAVSCPDDRAWLDLIEAIDAAPTLLTIDLLRWEDTGAELRGEIAAEGVVLFER